MARTCVFSVITFLVCSLSLNSCLARLDQRLEECLHNCYGIDSQETLHIIMQKFEPIIANKAYHKIVQEFIIASQKYRQAMQNNTPTVVPAPCLDGHEILFDSAYVSILWSYMVPGERVDFHQHTCKSIMVMVQGSTFKMEAADGTIEIDEWPIGVYELPVDDQAYAYTNIGTTSWGALSFEFKE